MKRQQQGHAVEMIPIERITVINPRVRNKKIFREIVENIAEIGLKTPITVARRDDADGSALRCCLRPGSARSVPDTRTK